MKPATLIRSTLLAFAVLCLLAGGTLLLNSGAPVLAQDEAPQIDYVGADDCADCHRDTARTHDATAHALTLQDDEDAILGDFALNPDLRMVQFPEEETPRAFTAADIAFSVGTGRFVQRYLYRVARSDYRLLPAEWDTAAGTWRRLEWAESWEDAAYDWEGQCAYCHTTGLDTESGRWQDDGVQCESCHGPGELHIDTARDAGRRPSAEEIAAIRTSINPAIDPQTCGQCHSRGITAGGQPFPAGFVPGDDLSAVFTLTALDQTDHWWVTGHASQPNMQYNEWIHSAHASALTTLLDAETVDASCLSCHSADYAYTQRLIAAAEEGDRDGDPPIPLTPEMAVNGVTCISCHVPHVETEQPAQLIAASYTLCVGCHSNDSVAEGIHHPVREMFEGAPLIEGIAVEPGAHFAALDGPTCTTCHAATVPVEYAVRASHALQPILPGAALNVEALQDNCSSCHEDVVTPEQLQRLIDDIQTNTRARIDAARAAVTDSTPGWVTDALDFVEGDGSLGIHNYAYADALLDAVFTELALFPPSDQ